MAKLAKYGIRDGASIEEIRKELVRAGKAANQRLRRLETAAAEGRTTGKGMSYTYAMKYLGKMGRTRFKERAARMAAQDVQAELAQIHAFLHGHQSTVTGIDESERKRYETYRKLGYKGTFEEFKSDVSTVFALLEEKGYGYMIGYELLTQGVTREEQRERITNELNEIRAAEDISDKDDKTKDAATGRMLLSVIAEKKEKSIQTKIAESKARTAARAKEMDEKIQSEKAAWVEKIMSMPTSRAVRQLNRIDRSGRYAEGFRQRVGRPDWQKEWLEKIYKGEV